VFNLFIISEESEHKYTVDLHMRINGDVQNPLGIDYYFCNDISDAEAHVCRFTPAHSFLVSGPVGTHNQIFVHSKTTYVL
jgi:hypothetical protein